MKIKLIKNLNERELWGIIIKLLFTILYYVNHKAIVIEKENFPELLVEE